MAKDNREILNYTFENAQMGVESTEKLLEISEDSVFLKHLNTQKNEYQKILDETKKLLHSIGETEEELSGFAKFRTDMIISMQTLTDKSTSHIAEMMMQGSTMGIVDAIRKLRNYTEVDDNVRALAEKLLKTEENNFEQLKKYI